MNFECKYSANFCNIHDFWTHVNLRFQSVGCQAAECIHYFWYWPREQWDLVIHICMKCHLLPSLRTNTKILKLTAVIKALIRLTNFFVVN